MGVVVKLSGPRDPGASLAPLVALVEEDMAHVNRIILDRARSNVDLIPELARHLIDSGGKRLRPMLTIASAKLFGYEGDGHVRLAASVEFMHTACAGARPRRGSCGVTKRACWSAITCSAKPSR